MYGLPEQTVEEARADVSEACALGPAHLSHYQLTLEPGTVFHARPPPLPDEDDAFTMQLECEAELAARGFVQYEVSAYARAGARCRHNLNYWRFGDYLGIGAGAHGKLSFALPREIVRTSKPKQPRIYQLEAESAHAPLGERHGVPPASLPFEFMLNALRLNDGFRARDFEERTGLSLETVHPKLERAHARGLLEVHASEGGTQAWAPTQLGSRFLNDLQAAFLE
jgi:oxygen-independent coproporphyrinogen-3 oxidase